MRFVFQTEPGMQGSRMVNGGKRAAGMAPDRGLAESSLSRTLSWSQPRFALLLVLVLAQVITVLLTWDLWQVRQVPPNLPVADIFDFQISFAWVLVASSLLLVWFPRFGVWFQLVILLMAVSLDQFRFVPQVFFIWLLMVTVVFDSIVLLVRWYLAAFWIWTGLHKLLSADWLGYRSYELLAASNIGLDPADYYLAFGLIVGLVEVVLGLLVCFRPRLAACGCVVLHLGIALFLLLIVQGRNESVIPWNVSLAIVGYWILVRAASVKAVSRLEIGCFALFMIIPVGFYFGWVNRTMAHVLYSENIPRGYVSRQTEPHELIRGWGSLGVPFPNERRILRQYFAATSKPGEKLHIREPRPFLSDQFWLMTEAGPVEVSQEDFLAGPVPKLTTGLAKGDFDVVRGVPLNDPRAMFALSEAGVQMRKKDQSSMVFAIVFPPDAFDRSLLDLLVGVQSIEQIQLSGTSIVDDDLKKLKVLSRLTGIGLDDTAVTDAGLEHLVGLNYLEVIQHQGTQITDEGVAKLIRMPSK